MPAGIRILVKLMPGIATVRWHGVVRQNSGRLCRRDLLDHIMAVGERHLTRRLSE